MTQWQKTLSYLREHSVATSNELRSHLSIVDVPKVISILRKKGYPITSKGNSDGTATYFYDTPNPKFTHYAFRDKVAEVHQGLEESCAICNRGDEQLAI